MNTGFIAVLPKPSDFLVGQNIVQDRVMDDNWWTPYLPVDEWQVGTFLQTMACTTFSATNSVETQINYMILNHLLPSSTIHRLAELGFLENGFFNASDRWTAKKSGTTRVGNDLVSVWHSIRHDGLVPERDWPFPLYDAGFDWDDYYQEPPKELEAKGQAFLEMFDVFYEWLLAGGKMPKTETWQEWLRPAPIQIATPVCSGWSNKIPVPACTRSVEHATLLFRKPDVYHIFDSMKPFRKQLAEDYSVPFAMRGIITPKLPMTNAKVLKDKQSNTVGVFLPALSPFALKSMCLNHGILVPEVDGDIDWDALVDGSYELKLDV